MNRYDKERSDKWASWTKGIDNAFKKKWGAGALPPAPTASVPNPNVDLPAPSIALMKVFVHHVKWEWEVVRCWASHTAMTCFSCVRGMWCFGPHLLLISTQYHDWKVLRKLRTTFLSLSFSLSLSLSLSLSGDIARAWESEKILKLRNNNLKHTHTCHPGTCFCARNRRSRYCRCKR